MLEFALNYVLPILSFAMAAFFFIKFYKFKDVLDDGTITLIRQVKSWWGTSQGLKSAASRSNSKDYKSATGKVGNKIKDMIPFGLLDELTPEEVHAYIMNEDTVKFAIKVKELFGGEWKLPGMPQLPGQGGGGPDKREEMKPI